MTKKNILKSIFLVIAVVVLYNSFYLKNLTEMKKEIKLHEFNLDTYAKNFWNDKLIPNLDNAKDIEMIISYLKTDMSKAIEYSNTLGVSSIHSYMLKGVGQITLVSGDHFIVELESKNKIEIKSDFIFGNSVRDASGLIDVSDFPNTMAFNNVSEKINEFVVNNVLEPIIGKVEVGKTIEFIGAADITEDYSNLDIIKIIPVKLILK